MIRVCISDEEIKELVKATLSGWLLTNIEHLYSWIARIRCSSDTGKKVTECANHSKNES